MMVIDLDGIVDRILKMAAELSAADNSTSYIFSNPMATWNRILDPSNKKRSHNRIMIRICKTLEYRVKNQLRVMREISISCPKAQF